MSALRLDSVPDDINECINIFLDLHDLNNVRLASRSMNGKASQSHFRSYFKSRRIDMTRSSLELTAEITEKHRIGCAIEELTLVGMVYNTAGLQYQLETGTTALVGPICEASGGIDEPTQPGTPADLAQATAELNELARQQADYNQFHAAGNDVALLTRIFTNLATNTRRGGLKSITTDVAVFRQNCRNRQPADERLGWRSVWQTAAETFQTLMLSLAESLLPVQCLNLFWNDFSGHCSLRCNELSLCNWHAEGIAHTLTKLASLSISISDRILQETKHDGTATGDPVELLTADENEDLLPNLEDLTKQATEDENYSGLVALLNSCKQLRKLDLRRCYVRRRREELHGFQNHRFLQDLVEGTSLATLQICSLENFKVRKQDLLALVKRGSFRELRLRKIGLVLGTWDSIFEYCTDQHVELDDLHLEDLYQEGQHLLFADSSGELDDFLVNGWNKGQSIFKRQEGQLRPIIWHIPRYQALRPQARDDYLFTRMEQHRNLYGPPVSHYPGVHL